MTLEKDLAGFLAIVRHYAKNMPGPGVYAVGPEFLATGSAQQMLDSLVAAGKVSIKSLVGDKRSVSVISFVHQNEKELAEYIRAYVEEVRELNATIYDAVTNACQDPEVLGFSDCVNRATANIAKSRSISKKDREIANSKTHLFKEKNRIAFFRLFISKIKKNGPRGSHWRLAIDRASTPKGFLYTILDRQSLYAPGANGNFNAISFHSHILERFSQRSGVLIKPSLDHRLYRFSKELETGGLLHSAGPVSYQFKQDILLALPSGVALGHRLTSPVETRITLVYLATFLSYDMLFDSQRELLTHPGEPFSLTLGMPLYSSADKDAYFAKLRDFCK